MKTKKKAKIKTKGRSRAAPARAKKQNDSDNEPKIVPLQHTQEDVIPTRKQFFVVGIGASAGGLDAVSKLVGSLPADFGMALILVTHMSRTQQSSLPEILSNLSRIPVVALKETVLIEPNHLYVMSPDSEIVLSDGNVKIVPCETSTRVPMPIDRFFFSLAATRAENAIAIVLSGEASDGALGVRAIKDEGGITFAQDPNTTEHPSMPSRAIASGAVDFVLSPADIGAELHKLAIHPLARSPLESKSPPAPQDEKEEDLTKILRVIHTLAGIDFSRYKKTTIQRRIERRMLLHKSDSFASYLKHLKEDSTEVEKISDDLLIKVTSFFRDPHLFEALTKKVFPRIIETKSAKTPIRIWIPGCSTGEEVYSVAISLLEFLDNRMPSREIQFFGTDLSEKAIGHAREGLYLENVTAQLSQERLRRFFKAADHGYQICKSIRDMCIFANHDIMKDPPFSRVDLVSCRNLLIYFNPDLQKNVISILHYALNPNGFLSLGPSETISGFSDAFTLVDKNNKIYSKKFTARRLDLESFHGREAKRIDPVGKLPAHGFDELSPEEGLIPAVDRIILTQMTPPGFIVSEELDILQFRGDSTPYVKHLHGTPSLNLLKVIRPELAMEVRRLTHDSRSKGPLQSKNMISINHNGSSKLVRLHVTPIKMKKTGGCCFLIVIKELDSPEKEAASPSQGKKPSKTKGEFSKELLENQRLERELQETKEHLQSITEEYESTNEEFKSSNEEILSANEELQSTNEELETSKEELQSTNEELSTVNDELRNQGEELTRTSNDLNNFITSTNLPLVMLTNDLRVRRFTPQAEKFFHLIPSDEGRSITDISSNFTFPDLEATCLSVIDTLQPQEKEIQANDGIWYRMQIRPYRTDDNRIEGIVLTSFDIDQLKKNQQVVEQSLNSVEATLQTVHEPLIELDEKLCVVRANNSFYRDFQVSEQMTVGSSIYSLGNGQWNIPKLRKLLEEVIPEQKAIDGYRMEHEFEHIGKRVMLLYARQIFQMEKGTENILLGIEDITEREKAESELTDSVSENKELVKTANTASAAKSAFIANISHEIRTPLTAIAGFAQRVVEGNLSDDDRWEAAEIIKRNTIYLQQLINDVLDLSKIESGKIEIENVCFSLTNELSELFLFLKRRAADKNVVLDFLFEGPFPETITSDPMRFRQILINVIVNAIKFTDKGNVDVIFTLKSTIGEKTVNPMLQISVKDTGRGITEEEAGRLFRPFNQSDGSITRKFGGTGLGLFVSRSLANKLGGDVVLDESRFGKGSTFTITIDPGLLDDDVHFIENMTQSKLEIATPATAAVDSNLLSGMKILVAEDSQDIQTLIKAQLESRGASADLAENGVIAIEKAKNTEYDLILMDIQMPILDGYSATQSLRAEGYKGPIVALTARLMKEELEKCLESGCNEALSKPLDHEKLFMTVKNYQSEKS